MTAWRIAPWIHPRCGPYMHWSTEAGHWPFYSSRTVQPSVQPRAARDAGGLQVSLCLLRSQRWAGWSDPLQKAAQILATLFWYKQIKQEFKPNIQGRAEGTVGCGRESETYGLSALGNQRGPGHGPKYWHSIIPLLSSQCHPWHGLVPQQTALIHNAWTHFSNSQGPFPTHSLDGPPCWGGRGREFMGKSHDTPSGLGASKQFSGLFYLLV